ncbi:hypothetical protein [Ruania albidiflava]|uniref:hypothetical protein n=1 Tax=Ruania albidiflava TaxID=366586 RepID=UPI0003B6955F|nr:hypothetical protein [Ruania albidiflava]
MTDARWQIYPTGAAGPVRAIGSMLLGLPLIAALMILPFLAARHIARLGGFGAGPTGQVWTLWAEYGLGLTLLVFALSPLAVALVHLVRTILMLGALRRAVRGGATAVPHPDEWGAGCGWSGRSLVVAGLLAGIVLAFPGVLTDPVGTWVQSWPVAQDWRMVGIPVAGIGLASIFQRYRKRALGEIERRWPESAREEPEAAAKERVTQPVLDSDGDAADPTQLHRTPLDQLGDKVGTAALVLTGIAALTAVITIIAAAAALEARSVLSRGETLMLSSSMLLLAGAIVLYVISAVMQNIARTGELRALLASARNPAAGPPPLGVLARHWSTVDPLWSNFAGLLGALVLLLALPARPIASGTAQDWGSIGLVAAVLLLVLGAVLDIVSRQRTRESRNLVLQRWPILKPRDLTKWYEELMSRGAAGNAQSYGAMAAAALEHPTPPGATEYGGGAQPSGGHAPPGATSAPVPPAPESAPYPPPPGGTPYPSGAPYPPAAGTGSAVRPRGLRKKLRQRGLGNLYR